MQNETFEQALDEFLEQAEYDAAYEAIFQLVKAAFLAGWKVRESQPPAQIIPLQDYRFKKFPDKSSKK